MIASQLQSFLPLLSSLVLVHISNVFQESTFLVVIYLLFPSQLALAKEQFQHSVSFLAS